MNFFIDTFIFLFILIDPFAVLPVFIALTRSETNTDRLKMALRACVISCVLLLVFAFSGEVTLDFLGITTPALRVAGGILLLLLAINMLNSGGEPPREEKQGEDELPGHRPDIAVFPIAIPLIAGPGAITGVIMRMRETAGDYVSQGLIVLCVILISLITYGFLVWSNPLGRLLGTSGTNIIIRILGIILAALACQFILTGLSAGLELKFIKP